MKTIIIGSGMAGLTEAAYLAQSGHAVTVYEQFPEVGGVTATLKKDGFGWDLGPLILEGFGPDEPAGVVLKELGLEGKIRLERQDRGLAFPGFSLWKPAEYQGPYWRRERLKQLFPAESAGLHRYYRFYDQVMDLMALLRRLENTSGPAALLLKARLALAFSHVKGMQNWNAQQLMDHFFQGPELKGLFTAILADFVVRPSQFPALGIPSVNIETAFDRRIPRQVSPAGPRPSFQYVLGGCGTLVEAFAGLARSNGVKIFTKTPVERILVEQGKVKGVRLADGQVDEAERVIASGGARETFYRLVGREHLPESFASQPQDVALMESVLMVHVGIDFDPRPFQQGALCYYYHTYDVEGGVQRCQDGAYHEGRDGFLIYVPSMHSPELAPPGLQALTVYTIAPNRLNKGDWSERREQLADKLLAEAEKVIPGLRQRFVEKVILTPEDFRARTSQEHHSFGGCAPVMGKQGVPHQTPIRGLWFIGSQSESRGGVAGVMAGARKAVHLIQQAGD